VREKPESPLKIAADKTTLAGKKGRAKRSSAEKPAAKPAMNKRSA
jgi:hypothetical protein